LEPKAKITHDIVPMKTGYPPEAAIWYAADHGVIQEGAPEQREGSPMTQYYGGLDVHSKHSTFVIEDSEGHVRAEREAPAPCPARASRVRAIRVPAR